MAERPLPLKRQRFAELYAGNGVEAARAAGYAGDADALAVTASRLLRDAKVAALIKARESKAVGSGVATRQQRQAFWTAVMQGRLEDEDGTITTPDVSTRLKASELLGRSEADFTENHRHEGARVSFVFNRGKK